MSKPFKGRREDARFVQGAGRYSADWNLPDQLHAVFVRSPHAHARIVVHRHRPPPQRSPGVLAVLTGEDAAAACTRCCRICLSPDAAARRCWPRNGRRWRAMTVHHAGEEVAVVIAETRHQAADAAELVSVEYENSPAVIGVDAALAPGAPLVHPEIPGNVCFEHEYGDAAAAEAAIAAAAHVVRLTLDSPRVAPNPMEPRAVLADLRRRDRRFRDRLQQPGRQRDVGRPRADARRRSRAHPRARWSMSAARLARAARPIRNTRCCCMPRACSAGR